MSGGGAPVRSPRRALVILAVVVVGLGVATARVVLTGRAALAAGDTAAAEGRTPDAIAAWEAAARGYAPLAPHVDAAYARLRGLAAAQHRHALPAWRAVRSAALATRHLWTPHAADLAAANQAIAELASRDPEGAAAGGPDAATRQAFHAERLARDPRPSTGVIALMLAAVSALLGGIALVLTRGFDAAGQLVRRRAGAGAALAVGGIGLWAVTLLAGV